MIKPAYFFELLRDNGIDFFTGVPDSLLKDICAYITDNTTKNKHIISANEGGAVALAAGNYLATSEISLVYMQNSGLGNSINPLLSLAAVEVYSIPILLLIGWRGEPGTKDEPQHIKQGAVTLKLLEASDICYDILPNDFEKAKSIIEKAIMFAKINKTPYALVVRKDTFEKYSLKKNIQKNEYDLEREEAIKMVINNLQSNDIVIATTGKISRELYEYRDELQQSHSSDFLMVGSMGHAGQTALAIAIKKTKKRIFCLDGDGSLIMHTGALAITGSLYPKNYIHIIFNNQAHDSVGGQPTVAGNIDFVLLAKSMNYKNAFSIEKKLDLKNNIKKIINTEGPVLLEIKVKKGARKNLSRPKKNPVQNKNEFMKFIQC